MLSYLYLIVEENIRVSIEVIIEAIIKALLRGRLCRSIILNE